MGHLQNAVLLLFSIMLLIIIEIQFSCSIEAYSNHASCIDSERRALVKFKEGLIDKANRLLSWSGENCCSWEGVSCNNLTGHVVKLELANPVLFDESRYYFDVNYTIYYENYQLGGPVFLTTKSLQWVAQLASLKSLDLSEVQIEESKDWFDWMAMLPSLSSLNLMDCSLDLSISPPPLSLVNLTLASLDLGGNEVNSTVPLWLFNISSLENLSLERNNLRGSVPSMFKSLKSLTSLDLSSNNLSSSLEDTLCNLTSLVQMNLKYNIIQGSLPICLGNLTSLTYLNLGFNDIKGSIPSSLGQLTKLNFLDLSWNQLNGIVPSTIGQLTKLNLLDLSYNQLNGIVPSTIGQLEMLKVLDISSNLLSGMLSELHFETLTELKKLYTTSNKLKLNVSTQWIPPFQLENIQMDFTQTGPQFPQWLRTQKNVESLSMRYAGISGPIPDWFADVFSRISFLDLSNNNLTGNIPEFFRAKNNNLERRIFLNSNKFEGPLEPFPLDAIMYLDLSENFLSGPIHSVFGGNMTAFSLEGLMLGDNQLSGNIPDDICNISTLIVIYLPNNQLSGRIPPCLGNLRLLQFLVLSNNSFSGRIPSVLGKLEDLNTLHLNENKFYGQFPSALQNLKNLENLDLGGNQLKGTIPGWIGKELLQLKFLRLQSNNFYGDIPLKICRLSSLQVLNLAQNKLTGRIPHCFQNLSAMASNGTTTRAFSVGLREWTDFLLNPTKGRDILYTRNLNDVKSMVLSENRLVGEIPNELMDLVELQSLNLSYNCLSGIIPVKIGNLKHLESLDLARNRHSGAIPPSLASIDSLSYLNLSFNNLSERIPSGNQLQTLNNESIYEENSGLCGKPLPNSCPDDRSSTGINGHFPDDDDGFEFSWFYAGIGQGCSWFSWSFMHFPFQQVIALCLLSVLGRCP